MLVPKWQAVTKDGRVINQGEGVTSLDLCDPSKEFHIREFRVTLPPHIKQCVKCGAQKPQPPKILVNVYLDQNKRLIYRRRPPFRINIRSGKRLKAPLNHVVLVGWQQTLDGFKDKGGNSPNIQMVSIIDEVTHEVLVMDRFHNDVAIGSHPTQLHPQELADGWQGVIDPDEPSMLIPIKSTTQLLDFNEEREIREKKLRLELEEGKEG